ncbi:hypothetical protein RQP46_001474 [Phenoliferia psychrophenolica]
MSSETVPILQPIQVGDVTLQHRIALCPLTRFRADANHVVHDVTAEYYAQRSAAPGTLLISEATFISGPATGYTHAPGVWTEDQIAGWKKVVDAVHAKGSFLYLPASSEALKIEAGGPYDVVSASDLPFKGGETPRPLTEAEIQEYIGWYATAAKNFVELAGGDGVEIHNVSNVRTDKYGGSVENRCRFGLEVVKAVVDAVGAKKTAIRLSPYTEFQGMKMSPLSKIKETFSYLISEIAKFDLAYLHVVESRASSNFDRDDVPDGETLDFVYDLWKNPIVVAGGFNSENILTEKRPNTIVGVGRFFISNPDLVERVRKNIPFTPYDRSTFYLQGPEQTRGYTDWPTAAEAAASVTASA